MTLASVPVQIGCSLHSLTGRSDKSNKLWGLSVDVVSRWQLIFKFHQSSPLIASSPIKTAPKIAAPMQPQVFFFFNSGSDSRNLAP